MSPTERLRWLITPGQSRWQPMLMGLAVFTAVAGVTALLQPPKLVEAPLIAIALAAWVVGACAMVGYVRWFFAAEMSRAAARGETDAPGKDDKQKGTDVR